MINLNLKYAILALVLLIWILPTYSFSKTNFDNLEIKNKVSKLSEKSNYTQGVFFLNEDWFGHSNGTINFLTKEGEWVYRVFAHENPNYELGVTSQFGAIYGDKMYIMSKQAHGSSDTSKGSYLAICNASTMKIIKEFKEIGGGNGRAFLGVDESIGYIGTTWGIVKLDIANMSLDGKIEGTFDHNEGQNSAQIGNMIRVGDRVFAIRQQVGVYVINALNHSIETTINGNFGSIVLSKDATLWLSIDEVQSSGKKLIKLNPYTLEITTIELPESAAIPNSWGAWTADAFFSSKHNNVLYWKNNGGSEGSTKIFKYIIGDLSSINTPIYDCTNSGWKIYGASCRADPLTDDIYVSMFKNFGDNSYKVVKLNNNGEFIAEYTMENYFWFPSLPIFTDNFSPETTTDFPAKIELTTEDNIAKIYLGNMVTDNDNINSGIIKSIIGNSNPEVACAKIENDTLIVEKTTSYGTTNVNIKLNSNGKIIFKSIEVNYKHSFVDDFESIKKPYLANGILYNLPLAAIIEVFSYNGQLIYSGFANSTTLSLPKNLHNPFIIRIITNNKKTFIIK